MPNVVDTKYIEIFFATKAFDVLYVSYIMNTVLYLFST